MNSIVLLVDDEPNVLRGYQRTLGDMFETRIATSGAQALEILAKESGVALIVTDYRMPGMTGVELLRKAREMMPDTVRMLITGYADVKISLEAINEGSVFRMLTKPCDTQSFYRAIEDGLRQHELITSEKELLDQTLKGAVQMLGDIISVLDHGSFGRAQKLALAARQVADKMKLESRWEVEVAATLAEVGRATLPGSVARKRLNTPDLSEAEKNLLTRLPEFSSRLLAHIPRLEPVAQMVMYQNKNYDGSGFPADGLRAEYLPMGARILHVLNELLQKAEKESNLEDVIKSMLLNPERYDTAVAAACQEILPSLERILSQKVVESQKLLLRLDDLREGQRLISNIETKDGVLIIAAGNIIRPALLQRIKNFSTIMPIKEPIEVSEA